MLDANLAQGIVAAERIRTGIEGYRFSVVHQGRTDENHQITVSIGVSCFPDDSKDPIELVEMADSALYRAKREGRNRIAAYRDITLEDLDYSDLPPVTPNIWINARFVGSILARNAIHPRKSSTMRSR